MEEALRALIVPAVAALTDQVQWGKRGGLPAIALYVVGGARGYVMKGREGLTDRLVQIDCWAATYADAKGMARAVIGALDAMPAGVITGAFVEAERDDWEAGDGSNAGGPIDFFRTSLDVRVWAT